jgi:two-component system chemotaxis sensor kinase CheA
LDFDRAAVVELFLAEAGESLDAMEQCLVALERRPEDAELVAELFRNAHTIKGNAASLGFAAIAEVTHVLEDLLDRRRRHAAEVTQGFVTLLLEAVDLLRQLLGKAARDDDSQAPGQEAVVAALRRAAAGDQARWPAASPADVPVPSMDDLAAAATAAGRGFRVGLDKLDRLVALGGEIAIARSRIASLLEALGERATHVLEAHRDAERLDREMQELVMRTRMVPLGPSFRQHARTVRDVALALGKEVRLVIEGDDLEADLAVVERLRDPLTHMVRNALDHGVELPEVRRARGKDKVATITLRAYYAGGRLVVELADDGAGLDRDRILARARERGLVGAAQSLSEREIYELIFRAGFSTADSVTGLSGRGIGMDVVRRNIAALRGTVEIASRKGEGTVLTIHLPLTLAVVPGFLVAAGDERYVLPLENVVECLDLPPGQSATAAAGVVDLRGEAVPYLRVGRVLGAAGEAAARESLVVVEHGDLLAGLAVDALLGEAPIVMKPMGSLLGEVRGFSGSTVLGDGQVALILDVATLIRDARTEAAA